MKVAGTYAVLPHMQILSLTYISRAQVYYLSNIINGNLIWCIKWLVLPINQTTKQQQRNCARLASQLAGSRGGEGKSSERLLQARVIQASGCTEQQHLFRTSTSGLCCSVETKIIRILKDTDYAKVTRLYCCCNYWAADLSLAAFKACWTALVVWKKSDS